MIDPLKSGRRTVFLIVLGWVCFTGTPSVPAAGLTEMDRLYKAGETQEELIKLEHLIRGSMKSSSPTDELSWRLARTYYALGNRSVDEEKEKYFSLCIEQAERTLQQNEKSALGYFFRGLCRGKLGEMQGIWKSLGAITPLREDMETAVKLDPSIDQGGPHRALGKLYYELPFLLGGDLDKSIAHLEKAVQYGPRYGENHLFLAQSYFSDNQFIKARKTLQALIQITRDSGNDEDTQSLLAEIHELSDKIESQIGPQETHAQRTEDQ